MKPTEPVLFIKSLVGALKEREDEVLTSDVDGTLQLRGSTCVRILDTIGTDALTSIVGALSTVLVCIDDSHGAGIAIGSPIVSDSVLEQDWVVSHFVDHFCR